MEAYVLASEMRPLLLTSATCVSGGAHAYPFASSFAFINPMALRGTATPRRATILIKRHRTYATISPKTIILMLRIPIASYMRYGTLKIRHTYVTNSKSPIFVTILFKKIKLSCDDIIPLMKLISRVMGINWI